MEKTIEVLKEEKIKVGDLLFSKYLSVEVIQKRVEELAQEIDKDFRGKDPIYVAILNGSFIFCSDLVRASKMDFEIEFLKVKSYEGLKSSGEIKELLNTLPDVEGRALILIEDIVDKGHTINYLCTTLSKLNPASIAVVSLLYKPTAYEYDLKINYVGFEIPNDFVVGYGLDYNGLGRSLKDIYVLSK